MVYYKRKGKRNYGGKKKRWSASADLGIFGKYRFSTRSLKNKVRSLETPKHKLITGSTAGLLHNGLYTLNLTGNIVKGDANANRDGDVIHIDALKYRIKFERGVDAPSSHSTCCRMMIVKHTQQGQENSDQWLSASLGSNQLFSVTNTNWLTSSMSDAKKVTVLYDKCIQLTPEVGSGQRVIRELNGTLPINQTFRYSTDSNYGKFNNIYAVAFAASPIATTGSTIVAQLDWNSDLIFKNSN